VVGEGTILERILLTEMPTFDRYPRHSPVHVPHHQSHSWGASWIAASSHSLRSPTLSLTFLRESEIVVAIFPMTFRSTRSDPGNEFGRMAYL